MGKGTRHKYTLKVASKTENLGRIRAFVRELSLKAGFSLDAAGQIELAVDEACTNVIRHAYKHNGRRMVELTAFLDEEKIEIIVSDNGGGFNIAKVRKPDIREYASKSKKGGLGIHMMRSLMDEVSFSMQPGKKNHVSLIKYLRKSL